MVRTPHTGRVKAAAVVLIAGLPFAALAGNGPYIGLEGGYNFQNNQNLDFDTSNDATAKFKPGWLAGGVAGYSFANGFRPELEVDFRRNQIRKVNVEGIGSTTDVGGFESNITGMANLWYDVKTATGFFSRVHPYIGGGVGISRFDIDKARVGTGVGGVTSNGFDTVFAYQGGAGVGFDITKRLTASLFDTEGETLPVLS